MMKAMASERKLEKAVTNHSLRSYGISKVFRGDVPEKVIMEMSGHQPLEGVRQYERTSALQEVQVCKVLETNENFLSHWQTPLLPDHYKLQHDQLSTFRGASLPTASSSCQRPTKRTFPTSTSKNFSSLKHFVLPFLV